MPAMPKKYPTEVMDRAVRMALDDAEEHGSPTASAYAIGAQLGIPHAR